MKPLSVHELHVRPPLAQSWLHRGDDLPLAERARLHQGH